jgi:CDP-diacylglycerol--glycerol-3-phosphate 3-phosphatidyltransferase
MKIEKKSIPNILTVSRILVIPIVILLFLLNKSWSPWAVLGFYVYASVTDFFDGYFARKFNVVSDLGRFLDPIADKLLVATLFILLITSKNIPGLNVIAVIIILLREIFVSGLREFLGPKNIIIRVTKLAKWKTTLQMIATCFLILNSVVLVIYPFSIAMLWLAAIITFITGFQYFKEALKYMK